MTEHLVQQKILLELGARPDLRIWRNSSGAIIDQAGRLHKFGLKGSADILGLVAPNGQFLAIEVKTERGRQSDQQKRFETMIRNMGGIYILARSVEDVLSRLPPPAK